MYSLFFIKRAPIVCRFMKLMCNQRVAAAFQLLRGGGIVENSRSRKNLRCQM